MARTQVGSPVLGTVIRVAAPGTRVESGAVVAVVESMKMEYPLQAPEAGVIAAVLVAEGSAVQAAQTVVELEPLALDAAIAVDAGITGDPKPPSPTEPHPSGDRTRADLAEVRARHAPGSDAARPDAVARRHDAGRRTTRENVEDLVDPGSLVEYAPLVVAAQRKRRSLQDLMARTPGDGMVAGVATVEGRRTVVLSYDYTVLAGTQGLQNHRKKDRLFELAERQRLPVVFFTEGGGGRPGDTDGTGVTGLDCEAFWLFGRLSGMVPLVGITAGFCFAGNAAILGCCDVVIAVQGANIGMGGPAMIEGGGLGVVAPEEIGPQDAQVANGVVDLVAVDDAHSVALAKQYLSYFGGDPTAWSCPDQELLRAVIPENRRQVYDVHDVIDLLCDDNSVLELRAGFAVGMVTALARIEGRAVGIVANNPMHLAGAIDADGADKAARFLQLCDAFDLPVVFLCDTPGFMVGPDAERTGLVRHVSRMFVTGANLGIDFVTVVLRKGYGLGAQAMAGGSFKAPLACVAWPTGEFGGMGLEGAVRLGYRKELDAEPDPVARQTLFEEMVARMYEVGKATNVAAAFEIDDVIDPAETRRWITTLFGPAARAAGPRGPRRRGKRRPNIDTW